jgi:hypothetical protein
MLHYYGSFRTSIESQCLVKSLTAVEPAVDLQETRVGFCYKTRYAVIWPSTFKLNEYMDILNYPKHYKAIRFGFKLQAIHTLFNVFVVVFVSVYSDISKVHIYTAESLPTKLVLEIDFFMSKSTDVSFLMLKIRIIPQL